jgi:hypothetical protein
MICFVISIYFLHYFFFLIDEDKNFCLEERDNLEQHNDLEISEGMKVLMFTVIYFEIISLS